MPVHFKNTPTPNTKTEIRIGDTIIKPFKKVKYLGVLFDYQLHFTKHIQHAMRKGTEFALAISRIAKCTYEPTFHYIRLLFTSVLAPRMDYEAIT